MHTHEGKLHESFLISTTEIKALCMSHSRHPTYPILMWMVAPIMHKVFFALSLKMGCCE